MKWFQYYINNIFVWLFTKIINTIWTKHEHLEGFSKTTIYRNLDESNRKLLHNNSIPHGIQKSQNNVIEESGVTLHPNVIEDSSPTFGFQLESDCSRTKNCRLKIRQELVYEY